MGKEALFQFLEGDTQLSDEIRTNVFSCLMFGQKKTQISKSKFRSACKQINRYIIKYTNRSYMEVDGLTR